MHPSQNYGKMMLTRASANKGKAELAEIRTAICSFMEKDKQNHCKSPKVRLYLCLFCIDKQRSRNEATYLETGFRKIMMKK